MSRFPQAGRIKSVFSKIKQVFSGKILRRKAEIDAALDLLVVSPRRNREILCLPQMPGRGVPDS